MSARAVRLSWHGDGRLFALDTFSARVLVERMAAENKFTRHEWSLLDLDDAPGVHTPVDPNTLRLHTRLGWPRKTRRDNGPDRPGLTSTELRRVEGILSSRALSGRWRVCPGEGEIHRVMIPTASGRRFRGALALHALVFDVEPISLSSVLRGGLHDYAVQRRDRSFSVVRFEGVSRERDVALGAIEHLEYTFRNRGKLTEETRFSLGKPACDARSILRWFSLHRAMAQPGFALMDGIALR